MCFEQPEKVRADLLANVRALLGPDFDVDTHFNPSYRPWQQRIAFVPDADLFRAIADGRASVATGRIERFTETGIRLTSGEELKADIVVAATRSEEHTSELQSLMRSSYAVFCFKNKLQHPPNTIQHP